MKTLLALTLISSQVYAHGHNHSHGTTDQAITGASIFWNGYEMATHAASFLGIGNLDGCCGGHMTKTYHAIEFIGHSSNLYGGISHWMETYTTPVVLSTLSLAFNVWAAHSQYLSLKSRGVSTLGIILAPMAALDLWGHLSSAYINSRELAGI